MSLKKFSVLFGCLVLSGKTTDAQLFRFLGNALSDGLDFFQSKGPLFGPPEGGRPLRGPPRGAFIDDGTPVPQATGTDEIYPADCGRHIHDGTGKLCSPDGILCRERVNRQGNVRFGNHLYWVSWQSDDHRLSTANWSWFNARNYCRKRCMDLVSIETSQEYDFIKSLLEPSTKYFWTSGRMCNFDGCDRDDFLPKNINGWFWSANQARMNPTNGTRFHDWSQTGGSRPPKPQPDNREKVELNGDDEACMAVLNNFYGDGIKWHDVACHHEKPIICEDVEGHLNFARQTFPELSIP